MLETSRVLLVAAFAVTLTSTACNEANPPPAAPVIIPSLDASPGIVIPSDVDAAPPPPSAPAAADLFACAADADCVAVPKVGCCPNGSKEAVNKDQASAYKLSFICPSPNEICPHYRVLDTRTPRCNGDAHRCEMVK